MKTTALLKVAVETILFWRSLCTQHKLKFEQVLLESFSFVFVTDTCEDFSLGIRTTKR